MLSTKRDIAYQRIKEMILQGAITSSSNFSEKTLADDLGMSRTPVREALQKLIQEGFMKGISRKGVMVSDVSVGDASEIIDFRMAVESYIVKGVRNRVSDDQCNELLSMIEVQKKAVERSDPDEFLEVDVKFHDFLARLYGNQLMRDLLLSVRERFLAAGCLILRGRPQMSEALEGHVQIVDALRRNDWASAERAMRAHLVFAKRALIS